MRSLFYGKADTQTHSKGLDSRVFTGCIFIYFFFLSKEAKKFDFFLEVEQAKKCVQVHISNSSS